MSEEKAEEAPKLPIRPMKSEEKERIIYVKVSDLLPGYEKSVEYHEAAVAYFDVMGVKKKSNQEDIESALADFAAPLRKAAEINPDMRVKVFSDCCFMAVPLNQIEKLLSEIRRSFEKWSYDGILVRGGLAVGSYAEYKDLIPQPPNFNWGFFAGSAVVASVHCESSGIGSLLYATDDCAKLLTTKYKEPILSLKSKKILGWSDEKWVLYHFFGGSLIRLLKVLSEDYEKDESKKHLVETFLINIKYSLRAINPDFVWTIILGILSMPNLDVNARKKAIELLQIRDPTDFETYKMLIDAFLKNKERLDWLLALTNLDSSLNNSIITKDDKS